MSTLGGRMSGLLSTLLISGLAVLPVRAEDKVTSPAATQQPATPKITDQLPQSTETAPAAPAQAPATTPPATKDGTAQPPVGTQGTEPVPQSDDALGNEDSVDDNASLGEIPEIKAVELNPQMAKNAIDTYMLLKDKYKDAKLEDYETLQEFVDKDAQGKAFEADVKAAGFTDVEAWNQAITTVSTTYANILNDQSEDLRKQIAEIEQDTELAQDMKDRLINSLKALIPSENNKKVVAALQADPAYTEKLKQLETEEE